MDIRSALAKLYSLHQFGIKLGLDSTMQLLEQIGNPHKELKCFHIAGSNGKGSTASFIASILMEMGFKIGLYTSPHFVRFNERIRINGIEISDVYISKFVSELEIYINKHEPTFFELTTALAFKYFEEENVDYAVIETGLGGRLDSTNVINPLASIITSISLEHTNILGDTIEKIAFEKSGIIKNNIPVITGILNSKAETVIRNRAAEFECDYFPSKGFVEIKDSQVIVTTRNGQYSLYKTPLPGFHQLLNAALAVKVISEVMELTDQVVLSAGIQNVIENSKIQGRFEIYSNKPKIIFDSAHNPEGIDSFVQEFQKESSSYGRRFLIFGVMKDKDYREMLRLISPLFTKIYLASMDYERGAKYQDLSIAANEMGIAIEEIMDPFDFIRQFMVTGQKDCLVILGSMYLLGEIKAKILEKGLDIEAATT
jgi:dihydrofolate synthase / folylpolyglutamate synthase